MTPKELAELEQKYMQYRYTASGKKILQLIAYVRELEGKLKHGKYKNRKE